MFEFNPKYVTHPSEVIFDYLEEEKIDVRVFLDRFGKSEDDKYFVNQEMADYLHEIFPHRSVDFWLRLQSLYEEDMKNLGIE